MKTKLKIIFILFCCCPILLQAQDVVETKSNHRLKIDLLRLAQQQLVVGYELGRKRNFSVGGELGYLRKAFYLEAFDSRVGSHAIALSPNELFNNNLERRAKIKLGLQANAFSRIYSKPSHDGFFLGLKGGFQYADFGEDITVYYQDFSFTFQQVEKTLSPRQSMFFGGLEVGYQYKASGRVNYEASFFAGRQTLQLIDPESVPSSNPMLTAIFFDNHFNTFKANMIRLSLSIVYKIGS